MQFILDPPPDSPLMMFNGAGFPSFVSNCAQLDHLAYLSDVARLELALRSAYHAADITQIHSSELEALAPDKLSKAYIELAPAVRLIRSTWLIHAIWCYNMRDGAPKPYCKLRMFRWYELILTRLPCCFPPVEPFYQSSAK